MAILREFFRAIVRPPYRGPAAQAYVDTDTADLASIPFFWR